MRHRHAALLAVLAAPVSAVSAFGYEALQPIDRNPSFLKAKITAVIHSIGEAINKDNFTSFREGYLVSSLMTQRISDQQLHDAFRLLIASKVDLTGLESVKPVMDGPPEEDAEHQLLVSGHYDTSLHVEFRMGFIREGSHLGLSKLDLRASPATAGAPVAASGPAAASDPAAPATKRVETARTDAMIASDVMASLLAGASLPKSITLPADQREAVVAAIHALTLGVTARDMDLFLKQDIVSPRWRQAQTGAQLAGLYRTTIERGADFAKFDGAEIIVPHEPVLGGSGELDINGLIVAADRERVAFRAGFEREGGTLRLINLLVARSRPAVP